MDYPWSVFFARNLIINRKYRRKKPFVKNEQKKFRKLSKKEKKKEVLKM